MHENDEQMFYLIHLLSSTRVRMIEGIMSFFSQVGSFRWQKKCSLRKTIRDATPMWSGLQGGTIAPSCDHRRKENGWYINRGRLVQPCRAVRREWLAAVFETAEVVTEDSNHSFSRVCDGTIIGGGAPPQRQRDAHPSASNTVRSCDGYKMVVMKKENENVVCVCCVVRWLRFSKLAPLLSLL